MQKIKIGFSPCPNDTFIFDALVNNKIDTGGLRFEARLEDVETLNRLAMEGVLDVTKLSYAVLPLVRDNYTLLNSGSALGSGVGPLLVAKEYISPADIPSRTIAIPGEHTTANLLFKYAFPLADKKKHMRYDKIEDYVLGTGNPGVIIHENRFTYVKKGLLKILDLGEYWQQKTGYPIPLGGIMAKKTLEPETVKKIEELIEASIRFAFSNYPNLPDYVKQHSQEMEEDIMRKHIDLYVNEFSLNLGELGHKAIDILLGS